MSSPIIEIFRETKKNELRLTCVSERMKHRARIIRSESSGGFLRANKENDRSVHIPVDCTGNEYEQTTAQVFLYGITTGGIRERGLVGIKPGTNALWFYARKAWSKYVDMVLFSEFYIEKNNKYEANMFRCCLGGQQYYLCAEKKNVFLLKTNACNPDDDKFLFTIAFVNAASRFRTIKSVRSEMFLVSDENGKASMREIRNLKGGQPEDRQAWFDLIDYNDMVTDDMFTFISDDMLTFTAKTCEV